MKKSAFTLAEILITLSIIGVIASMTIPSLVQDVQDAQLRTAWKKTFADFSQATKKITINNSGNLVQAFGDTNLHAYRHDNIRNTYLSYLNYTKICDRIVGDFPDCWHKADKWFHLSGRQYEIIGSAYNHSYLVLSNGTLIRIRLDTFNCITTSGTEETGLINNICGQADFDINGFKGPNTIGKDIFGLYILKNGNVMPKGMQGDSFFLDPDNNGCNAALYPNTTGWSCSADYLYK